MYSDFEYQSIHNCVRRRLIGSSRGPAVLEVFVSSSLCSVLGPARSMSKGHMFPLSAQEPASFHRTCDPGTSITVCPPRSKPRQSQLEIRADHSTPNQPLIADRRGPQARTAESRERTRFLVFADCVSGPGHQPSTSRFSTSQGCKEKSCDHAC